jgi:hypothetical protein
MCLNLEHIIMIHIYIYIYKEELYLKKIKNISNVCSLT